MTGVLGVFAIFICVTVPNMNTDLLAPSGYSSVSKIIASVAITFSAYLGFNVIGMLAEEAASSSA